MTEMRDEFGRGVTYPLRRDGQGDFANVEGLACLKNDLSLLLSIIGPSGNRPGEVPWRTDMGSRLIALKHRALHSDVMAAMAEQYTAGVIQRFERRAVITSTEVTVLDGPMGTTRLVQLSFEPVGRIKSAPFTVPIPIKEV